MFTEGINRFWNYFQATVIVCIVQAVTVLNAYFYFAGTLLVFKLNYGSNLEVFYVRTDAELCVYG